MPEVDTTQEEEHTPEHRTTGRSGPTPTRVELSKPDGEAAKIDRLRGRPRAKTGATSCIPIGDER